MNKKIKNIANNYYFQYFVVFLIYLILRLYKFGIIPDGINQDEAWAAYEAYSLSLYGSDQHGTVLPVMLDPWGYGQMSVLLSWLMVPFIKILGFNIYAIRLPLLIWSTLGTIAFGKILKEIIGKRAEIFGILFIAISPWHFLQSRWTLDCNLFPHMFIIALMFLIFAIKHAKKTKYVYLVISMTFFALCMYSYGCSFFVVPLFLIMTGSYLLINKKISILEFVLCIFSYLLISWPIYLTMFVNYFEKGSISFGFFTVPYFETTERTQDIVFLSDKIGSNFIRNLKVLMYQLVFPLNTYGNVVNLYYPYGAFYYFSIVFTLRGFLIINKKQNRNIFNTIFIIYFINCIILGMIVPVHITHRLNIIFYCLTFFIIVSLKNIYKNNKKLFIGIVIVYIISGLSFFNSYFNNNKEIFIEGDNERVISAETIALHNKEFNDEILEEDIVFTIEKSSQEAYFADFLDSLNFAKSLNSEKYIINQITKYYEPLVTEAITLYVFQPDPIFKQSSLYDEMFYFCDDYNLISKDYQIESGKNNCYLLEKDLMYLFDESFLIKEFEY